MAGSFRPLAGFKVIQRVGGVQLGRREHGFRPLAGFKVIQQARRLHGSRDLLWFPSPRGVQGYPTNHVQEVRLRHLRVSVPSRGSRLSNLVVSAVVYGGIVAGVSVPSRGSRLSNSYRKEPTMRNIKFPSPRGVQGYPTMGFNIKQATALMFPSPRGVQGYPTKDVLAEQIELTNEFPSPRGVQGYPTRRSAYVKYGRTTRFRPLAGFKVIQPAITYDVYGQFYKFPSPRGVQGYPTLLTSLGNSARAIIALQENVFLKPDGFICSKDRSARSAG